MQKIVSIVMTLLFVSLSGSFAISRIFAQDPMQVRFRKTAQTEINGELKKWHKVTLSFEGPFHKETDTSPNPFLDYRLEVTFINGNKTYKVPGFFAADGNAAESSSSEGNIWRVHFSPDAAGTWNYSVSFRSGSKVAIDENANAGTPVPLLDGKSGSFTVQESNKSGRDFRGKGRLKYTGEHYLQFSEDGSYFLKGGPDAPENFLAYEDFDNTPNNGGRRKSWAPHQKDWNSGDPYWQKGKGTEIIGAINYLAGKGLNAFSFLTMNIKGDDKNVYPYISDSDFKHFDCSKLDQWEIVFEHADKLGLYLHFKTQETENDQLLDGGKLGIDRKLYYRELIARYAHHLALNWNLGEENTNTTSQIKAFAQYFSDNDPYGNHIVLHTYPGKQESVYTPLLGNASKLTGASIQIGWNKVYKETKQWVEESAKAGKKWVVANDEQGSANTGVPPDNHSGTPDLNDIRKQTLWGNLMAGGAGVEYYFGYKLAHSDLTAEDFRSRDLSWNYVRHALDFFIQHLPFWQMSADEKLVTEGWCLAKEGEIYAIYLPEGGSADLSFNSTGTYQIKWYDPRNGGKLQNGSITTITGSGKKNIGQSPGEYSKDWVVLITKTKGESQEPKIKLGSSATTGNAPLTVNFDASESTDPDGNIVSFEWDFGDNTKASGSKVQHTFTAAGNYTVTLKITDNQGNTSTETIEIKVNANNADCKADFVEKEGLVVAEIESMPATGGWQKKTEVSDFTGNAYYAWTESNQYNSPGKGLLEFKIQINTPGTYRFQWRSKVGIGNNSTEHNDSWLKIPDADDFYGLKGSHIVRPKGVCTNDCPKGSSKEGWFKIYSSGTTNWTWSTRTSDHDAHDIYARFDKAGIYTVQISGRSKGHLLDRFVLYNNSVSGKDATKTSNTETKCENSPPPAQYQVTFTIKDENGNLLSGAEINFSNNKKTSDANGQVVFSGIINGNYNYTISKTGYKSQNDELEVKNDNLEKNITLIKATNPYTIKFLVSDQKGPLDGVIVNFNGNPKQTNAQGEASFTISEPGTVSYSITKNGYQPQSGKMEVKKNLTKSITLVADAASYEVAFSIDDGISPLANAEINLNGNIKTTDSNGQVIFSGVAAGVYNYKIYATGFQEFNGTLEITNKDEQFTISLEAKKLRYPVTFIILDEDNEPISSAEIYFNDTIVLTDTLGRATFLLDTLAAGLQYKVEKLGFIPLQGRIDVLEEDISFTFTLIKNEPVTIYPNPTVKSFKYKTKFQVERIEIKDIQDKFVQFSSQSMGNDIDVSALQDGMFIIFFYLSDGRVQVNKLIKK